MRKTLFRLVQLFSAALLLASPPAFLDSRALHADDPALRVAATVPELGMLAREVGGDAVEVTVFAGPREDPHFVDARPSFVRELNRADALALMGLELEIGWLPALIKQARNPDVLPGRTGHIIAATAVLPRGAPDQREVDRSMGDVHAHGSPHFLTDPTAGILVARHLRDRFIELRPDRRELFERRYADFERRIAARLFGAELTARYPERLHKLALVLHRGGRAYFLRFLEKAGERERLGGWLAEMAPYAGTRVIGDHNASWIYFAQLYGLQLVDNLEETAGITPSTARLQQLVRRMQAENIRLILSSAYYPQRYANFVAEQTDAIVVPLANQGGARPGTEDYEAFLEYNVTTFRAAADRVGIAAR